MNIKDAWNRMDSNTQKLVVDLWTLYNRSGSRKTLEEIREIFRNHDCENPSENELSRTLKR